MQQRARRNAHGFDQFDQSRPVRRRLQIFDDFRLLAAGANHGEHVPRRAAGGIVVDGHAHALTSFDDTALFAEGDSSQLINASAASAPASSATMKPGTSTGRIPEKLLVNDRAMATAGLANDVEDVNQ